mmetsp:Transcript_2551/g.7171  ORF Transcript_2551/g.7171 Transcript_2551/m.7171 type:complete len:289 (+) Transcript_2551:112-978(+)
MLTPRFEWILGMCSCSGWDVHAEPGEFQMHLSTDESAGSRLKHALMRGDSFDITFTPRSFGGGPDKVTSRQTPITPRQKDMQDQLELPSLHSYPLPPDCTPEDHEEVRMEKLLEMYRGFALDLHTGTYLTQLTSTRDYSDIHCQLMEDMTILKLDQSNGRIIEFPLTNVSKVYRIVKHDDKWYTAGRAPIPEDRVHNSSTEEIVVVEFMRRKLAFVFKEPLVSQRFLICMELLIRRAQQKETKKAARSLKPTFPPQHAQQQSNQCPTPRQVHNAVPAAYRGSKHQHSM